jgi:SAM-dependent methyltransferase
MIPKPKQWGAEYAAMFKDESVACAYQFRPTYPPQTYSLLLNLLSNAVSPKVLLDAGCGTGAIARVLAPQVDRVDAIDYSVAMIAQGRMLPGGNHSQLNWVCSPIETAELYPAYSMIVAAASLHWMEWEIVLPRFADHLAGGHYLAIVEDVHEPQPWGGAIGKVIGEYSLNRDFQPYTMLTIAQELERRGLFQQHGVQETEPVQFRQPVAEWVESFHARNGLSRERMGLQAAGAFDRKIERLVQPYAADGIVTLHVKGRVIWGRPAHSVSTRR